MKNLSRFLSLLLAASMLLVLNAAAFAAESDTGYTDVDANAWYAEAVAYAAENKLMQGTGGGKFSPDEATDLAMVVTILYRDAGTPAAEAGAPAGVPAGSWYEAASAWADQTGLLWDIDTAFTGAPLAREDMVTILWRYAGSPIAESEDFADEAQISLYAAQAVDWSRYTGVVSGKPGNLFDPKGGTTRAELAAILQRFLTLEQTASQPESPAASGKVLVAYFSASGNTEAVANAIADTLNADLFELTPETPYTSADLNWTDSSSRVNAEHNDPAKQDVKLTENTVAGWADYDTVFIGYPILSQVS